MAFDEHGQATTFERKVTICQRAYLLLTQQAGYVPQDIIFDVNVLSVGTGIPEHERYAVDFIEAVRWIKKKLPGALTSGGISNLSFAFRGNNSVREAMHAVFLYHAIAAGLDMGIVNPGLLRVYDEIEPGLLHAVEDVILARTPDATERLTELAQRIAEQDAAGKAEDTNPSKSAQEDRPGIDERLSRSLTGGTALSREDLLEALALHGRAVAVIEGPLMNGMARVGERFAAGKMFLPQVVKSAKVMRDAVALLQPYMEAAGSEAGTRPRILLATVQGDVHDIGKNILGIVLHCNGFEVEDLGVMVPRETILERAAAWGADLIGVSGLITPSLHQMEELCREMAARGLSTPLLIGGATTSALHTAVRLAPCYSHVFYAPDASASAVLATRLISNREATEAEEHNKQAELRALYARKDSRTPAGTTPTHSGLEPESPFPADSYLHGACFADIPARELSIADVLPWFDWKLFYAIWGIKSGDDGVVQLSADAIKRLEDFKRETLCHIRIAARFDACHAEGDDLVAARWRLPMLRQDGPDGRSLADFVAPAAFGFDSPAGMFAISVHESHPSDHCCPACSMEYDSLLDRSLRLTLAEAASAWLEAELVKQLPKDSPVRIIKPAAGYASCPDHSLKRDILALLPGAEALGIRLTESCAMIPDASICALVFAHPAAVYPEIRRLPAATLDAYASRRGFTPEEKRLFLGHLGQEI